MKTVRIIKYAVLAMVLFAGCSKENESSRVPEDDLQTYTQVIPVTFEGMEDTKMTLDGETGECTWTEMDNIALCVNDNATLKWYYAPVVGKAVRLDLATGVSRTRFACYPGFSPSTHDYTNTITTANPPVVTYYNQVSYATKPADWTWAPMIAENTGETLKFFHVGGLVRITVNNIPSNYNNMVVTFYGKGVIGDFTVTNAGTANATTTATDVTSSSVSITNLTNSGSGFYANIPIPAGDYAALTRIEVKVSNQAAYTQSLYFPNGWGEIKHGEGRRLTFDMSGSVSGGDGTIHSSYHYKPHFLKWNDSESKYEMFDDPLELMVHSTDADIDVYWHRTHSVSSTPEGINLKSLRYRVLGDCLTDTVPPIPFDGRYYHALRYTEANYFWSPGTVGSILNGSGANSLWITVDLTDATPENGAAMDYRGKGTHNADGTRGENTNYVCGRLILSNNMTIVHPNLRSGYAPDGAISYTFYKQMIDAGCFFYPCLGYFVNGSIGGTITNQNSSMYYFMSFGSYQYQYGSFGGSSYNSSSSSFASPSYLFPVIVLEGQ